MRLLSDSSPYSHPIAITRVVILRTVKMLLESCSICNLAYCVIHLGWGQGEFFTLRDAFPSGQLSWTTCLDVAGCTMQAAAAVAEREVQATAAASGMAALVVAEAVVVVKQDALSLGTMNINFTLHNRLFCITGKEAQRATFGPWV